MSKTAEILALNPDNPTYRDLQAHGIEVWLDENRRLMLSDPSRCHLPELDGTQSFEMPLANDEGVFAVLVFERRLTVKGRRIFQATAIRQTNSQTPHQSVSLLGVLGLRQEDF